MTKKDQKHYPSFYRGLIRELKSKKGRTSQQLLADARTIQDPYYKSLALLRISDGPHLPISEARLVAREAIRIADQEQRLWRRAELYAKLAKHAKTWNVEFSKEDSQILLDEILNRLHHFHKGKGLSQNLNEISKHLGCKRITSLLTIALRNNEFMLDDSKTVIRQWATTCAEQISPDEIYTVLSIIENPFVQAKLFGYFYLQCTKRHIQYPIALKQALASSLRTDQKQKNDALRYLSRIINSEPDFELLREAIRSLPESIERVKLLTTLAGQAHKQGFNDISISTFTEALNESKKIDDTHLKAKERIKIATGYLKINEKRRAKQILETSHQSTTNTTIQKTIEQTMKDYDLSSDEIKQINITSIDSKEDLSHLPQSTGFSLGLFNTYEGSIKPIHKRTLARAAPLCAAFGLNLALIGFPLPDVSRFIENAIIDTTIGSGGKYLKYLYDENRIHLYSLRKNKIPKFDLEEIVIATTDHPQESKSVGFQQIIEKYHDQSKKNIILVMGLGKKGLPSTFLDQVDYQLELTGKKIPLETCTVMGIIAIKINEALQKQ